MALDGPCRCARDIKKRLVWRSKRGAARVFVLLALRQLIWHSALAVFFITRLLPSPPPPPLLAHLLPTRARDATALSISQGTASLSPSCLLVPLVSLVVVKRQSTGLVNRSPRASGYVNALPVQSQGPHNSCLAQLTPGEAPLQTAAAGIVPSSFFASTASVLSLW